MNTDQTYNLIQKMIVLASGSFIVKGWGDKSLWEMIAAGVAAAVTIYISHRWNASPTVAAVLDAVSKTSALTNDSTGGSQPNSKASGIIRLPFLFLLSSVCVAIVAMFIVGCAHIQPGQDPIIVNAERAQTYAASTFDLVLGVDNSSRDLWRAKAPAFHDFCEWLRQPQLAYLPDGSTTNVQRDIAMQLNLDKVKLDYKASKVTSNAVLEAISTLESAEQQANAWLLIVTNPAPKITPE